MCAGDTHLWVGVSIPTYMYLWVSPCHRVVLQSLLSHTNLTFICHQEDNGKLLILCLHCSALWLCAPSHVQCTYLYSSDATAEENGQNKAFSAVYIAHPQRTQIIYDDLEPPLFRKVTQTHSSGLWLKTHLTSYYPCVSCIRSPHPFSFSNTLH